MFNFILTNPAFHWLIGISFGGIITYQLTKIFIAIRKGIISFVKPWIQKIKDDHLRTLVYDSIIYIATKFPNVPGNKKFDEVLNLVCKMIPDVIPDDKLKAIIESTYMGLKEDLENIKK